MAKAKIIFSVFCFFQTSYAWDMSTMVLLEQAKNMNVNNALNNTFGFGGYTDSSIFKKYQE